MDEITGNRPSNYSVWHRKKLPEWCKMVNGDFFEQRLIEEKYVTVALVETIQIRNLDSVLEFYPIWSSKKVLLAEVEEKMWIPAFVVWHNPECTQFQVYRPKTDVKPVPLSELEFIEFVKNIHVFYYTSKQEGKSCRI